MTRYPDEPGYEASSATSRAAARSVAGITPSLRQQALELLRRAEPDGLTTDELERITGWPNQTASARMRELILFGHAYDTDQRRRTQHGRMATVRRILAEGAAPPAPAAPAVPDAELGQQGLFG